MQPIVRKMGLTALMVGAVTLLWAVAPGRLAAQAGSPAAQQRTDQSSGSANAAPPPQTSTDTRLRQGATTTKHKKKHHKNRHPRYQPGHGPGNSPGHAPADSQSKKPSQSQSAAQLNTVAPAVTAQQQDQQLLAQQRAQAAETVREQNQVIQRYVAERQQEQARGRIQEAPGPGTQPPPYAPVVRPSAPHDNIQSAPGPSETTPTELPITPTPSQSGSPQ